MLPAELRAASVEAWLKFAPLREAQACAECLTGCRKFFQSAMRAIRCQPLRFLTSPQLLGTSVQHREPSFGLRLPLPHLGACPEVIERQRRGVSAEPPRRADTPGLRLAPKMFNDGYVILCLLPR